MASRGLWHFMGARTRRGLALSWSALFVLSLLLQYFSFALAPSALAVHDEGLFELDGDTIANNAPAPLGPADDWDSHPGATGNRFIFKTDPLSQQTDDIFTGGSTKDDLNTSGWQWTIGSVPDKDNIENAFAASGIPQLLKGKGTSRVPPAGSDAVSCGRRLVMRSTTPMMLAPG